MSLKKFAARNIVVLNLTYRPDASGEVMPPEMHAVFNTPVPIVYDNDYRKVIGRAYLMRVQNTIIADLHVVSGIEDEEEAKMLVQQMYPAISGRINQKHENLVLGLEITAISLSFNKNVDGFITRLGTNVIRERKPVA